MKKTILFLLFSQFIILRCTFAQAVWTWQGPLPQGNPLWDIKFLNTTTGFASGEAGVLIKTTNGGLNWINIRTSALCKLTAISIVNQNIIYVLGWDAVLKSTNGGVSWSFYPAPGPSGQGFNCSFFLNENTGWGGTTGRVFKTINGGVNWLEQYTGGNSYGLYFKDENTGFSAGGGGLGSRIIKTTNGGTTWNIVLNEPSGVPLLDLIFIDSTTGYATGPGIRKTTDGGTTWFSQTSPTNQELYAITAINTSTLVIVCEGGVVLRTTNEGNNWFSSASAFTGQYGVCHSGNGILYACGDNGILNKSSNSGLTWNQISFSFNFNMSNSFFINAQTGFIVGAWGGNIIKTTNSGDNWSQILLGLSNVLEDVFFIDDNTGFAAGSGGLIIKTTNCGSNWISQNSGTTADYKRIIFTDINTGYAAATSVLLCTSNGGIDWISKTLPGGVIRDMHFTNQSTGFIADGNADVYRTSNFGNNWTLSYHLGSFNVEDMDFVNENTGYVIGYNMNIGRLIRTTNAGLNWSIISSSPGVKLDFVNANTGYKAAHYTFDLCQAQVSTIWKTTDGGFNWNVEYPGILSVPNSIFAINSDTVFFTGNSGVILRRTEGTVGIQTISNNTPENYTLYQNYPNPFNPNTFIRYSIVAGDVVVLKIYDMLGKEIEILVNEVKQPGTYEVSWNAENYTSGVYFYKLTAGDYVESKKMVLIK